MNRYRGTRNRWTLDDHWIVWIMPLLACTLGVVILLWIVHIVAPNVLHW